MGSFDVINAPKYTTVAASGLATAIASARPGEVITVETAGAPIDLNVSTNVGGYGCMVVLPLDQVIRFDQAAAIVNGVHFYGGRWAADIVAGGPGPANDSIGLNTVTKCSWRSAHIAESGNGVFLDSLAADIEFNGCLFEFCRQDYMQVVGVTRMALVNNTFGAGIKGEKTCWFADGRLPVEGQAEGTCTAAGGTWEDTAHNDVAQIRGGSTDVTIIGNTVNNDAQGFVNFGTGSGDNARILVSENNITVNSNWAISFGGADVEVRDNIASSTDGSAPRIAVSETTVRARGGRNTAPLFTQPVQVDLDGSSITGDVVNPPALPNIVLPGWAPATPTPTPTPLNFAPYYVNGGGPRWSTSPAAPSVGDWITINRGQWAGATGATWEFRWLRDGTPISGSTAQVYQVQAADVGAVLTPQARGTNAAGTGDWHSYATLSPV